MYTEIIEKSKEVSKIMDICSHEKRLCMLCFLVDGPKNIGQIVEMLWISQSMVSQFALKMRDQGVLSSHKVRKEVFYEIVDTPIIALMKSLKEIYCR